MRTPRKPALPALAAVAVATAAAAISASPANADVTSVGGGAYGERVSVSAVVSATSGPRPSVSLPATGGGPYSANLAAASVTGLLSTGVLTVTTRGDRVVSHLRTATSSATVNNVNVGAGAARATSVRSTCSSNGTGSTGATTIVGSNLGVSSSPSANTVRRLPNGLGSVTFNEQIRTNVVGRTTSITVNAMHVRLDGGALGSGDIILGQSRCSANGPDVLTSGSGGTGSGSTGTASAGSSGSAGASGSAGTSGSAPGSGSAGAGVGAARAATPLPGTASFTG
jgi:hypothetical protein